MQGAAQGASQSSPFSVFAASATTLLLRLLVMIVSLIALVGVAVANDGQVDFVISETYLKWLADGKTIQPTFDVRLDGRTRNVHTLAQDCEMHLAGKPTEMSLGNPSAIVVEPPNLCKFPVPGNRGQKWPAYFDQNVMKRNCRIRGFPRIFTEHASGAEDPANPNHVFEIHPATDITCGDRSISFASFLKYFRGMRSVKPATATSCVTQRRLNVRHNASRQRYELQEEGGQCGNFAIIEVGFVERDWVRKIGGGHSAIARVSLDGESRTTLKLYTLEGSSSDLILADILSGSEEDKRLHLHGMFTYDYFAIVKAVRTAEGIWTNPRQWTKVEFPVAFVVFGTADRAKWGEH